MPPSKTSPEEPQGVDIARLVAAAEGLMAHNSQLSEALAKTQAALDAQATEIATLRQGQSRIIPQRVENRRDALSQYYALEKVGGENPVGVTDQILVDSSGKVVGDLALNLFPLKFRTGDRVRINPDACPNGDDRTWAQVARVSNIPIGNVGEITRIVFLRSHDQQWVYQCVIPGVTRGRGEGILERELELA